MTRASMSCLGFCIALASGTASAALDRTGDFALLDEQGNFHQLSRYQHRRGVVLMSYARGCANMDAMLSQYRELNSQFSEQGFEFLLIDAQGSDRAALRDLDLGVPILQDSGQLVSEALGISHAGDVRVLNPDRISLYYSGALAAELGTTLSAILEGPVRNTVKTQNLSPCGIEFPARDANGADVPNYVTDIAPMIIDNCVSCHRQFGVGPFALDSYLSLLGWSPMIKEVLLNKRMPPAQIDPEIGHSDSARYIATQDIQKLVHWLSAGAPRGEGDDPLEQFRYVENKEWLLGEPDLIVAAPTQRIPATGVLDYVYADVDLLFDEDKWVVGMQYQAVATSALHHLMSFVTLPGEDFWGEERSSSTSTRRFLDGYSPGEARAERFPEGTAVRIPKGAKLSMQFHYVGVGAELFDETKIALYFADPADIPHLKERMVQAVSAQVVIPPKEHDVRAHAQYTFEESIVISGVRAKMNARGKNMRFSVEHPDGTMQDILSVPAYNYGWQPHYVLEQPIAVPAGSTVHVSGAFDNSVSNPFNPDPNAEVRSGLKSTDEMFTGYFTFHRAD